MDRVVEEKSEVEINLRSQKYPRPQGEHQVDVDVVAGGGKRAGGEGGAEREEGKKGEGGDLRGRKGNPKREDVHIGAHRTKL